MRPGPIAGAPPGAARPIGHPWTPGRGSIFLLRPPWRSCSGTQRATTPLNPTKNQRWVRLSASLSPKSTLSQDFAATQGKDCVGVSGVGRAQLATGCEAEFAMAERVAADAAEGLVGADKGFVLERLAEGVDHGGGPAAELGQSAFANLAAFAPSTASTLEARRGSLPLFDTRLQYRLRSNLGWTRPRSRLIPDTIHVDCTLSALCSHWNCARALFFGPARSGHHR